jgi:hypothetical protein
VILRGPMRLLPALLVLVSGLSSVGCGNTCQDLGDRLCQCAGGGSARTSCQTEIKNQLSSTAVTGADTAACGAALAACHAPPGATFCEWVNTADAKVACGLAYPPATP